MNRSDTPRSDGQTTARRCLRRSTGLWIGVVLAFSVLWMAGCETAPSDAGVQSTLRGQITVRPSIDSSSNYEGFRILVVHPQGRSIDTLGMDVTNRKGRFNMTVTAPERGVYPLTIWGRRGQQRLASTDFVVAHGDSARLNATFPLKSRRLQVRSEENAAMAGYRNTLAQHRRTLIRQIQTDGADSNAMSRRIRQTSSILWSLRETFPGTYAAQLAATESLSLLAGWNDSLLIKRARSIEPTNPRYVEAVEIVRAAVARQSGQNEVLALLDSFETQARTDAQRAGIQAVRIRAFMDSLQSEAAMSAAQNLKNAYPDTKWATWADRAMYEVNNLLPGAEAPNIEGRTVSGDSFSLREMKGRPIVLEYYRPGNEQFARQLSSRNALYDATRADSVAFVSVSLSPDTLLYDAFLQNRQLPGHSVIAPDGDEDPIVEAYNVVDVPSRFLIDSEGKIFGRYDGSAFLGLQEDLTQMIEDDRILPR